MKKYPFFELDYLIRENGTGPFLAYIREQDDAILGMLQAGVPQTIQRNIDGHFWDVLSRIVCSEGDPQDKIQHVFDYCFELAFYRIKDHWYNPKADDRHRRFLSEQFTHSVGKSTQAILDKGEWQDYRQQYTTARDHFFSRLERNLSGYEYVEEKHLDGPDRVAYEELLPHRVETTLTFKNGGLRDIVYQRAINKLFDEVRQQRLIGDSDTARVDFRGLFYGEFHQKVEWLRSHEQLRYLINELVALNLIPETKKWKKTAYCFTKEGNALHPNQFRSTSDPRGPDCDTIDRIIAEVRDSIAGR